MIVHFILGKECWGVFLFVVVCVLLFYYVLGWVGGGQAYVVFGLI